MISLVPSVQGQEPLQRLWLIQGGPWKKPWRAEMALPGHQSQRYGWPKVNPWLCMGIQPFQLFLADKVKVADYVGGSKKGMDVCLDL